MSHTSVITSTASILGAKVVLRKKVSRHTPAVSYSVAYIAEGVDVSLFTGISRNTANMWFQKFTDKVMNGWVPE